MGILKPALRKLAANATSKDYVEAAIDTFLINYRSTPHTITGVTPAKLLFGKDIRARLSLLQPRQSPAVPLPHGGKEFCEGETVCVKLDKDTNWQPAVIQARHGNVTYVVQLHGEQHFVHRDSVRPCPDSLRPRPTADHPEPRRGRPPARPATRKKTTTIIVPTGRATSPSPRDLPPTPPPLRRSTRHRVEPDRLTYPAHHL